MDIRIGHGFDVHAFAENRKLILCGVEIENDKGLLGHSDADVVTHAIMDAILGASAKGDIGRHFPDTDVKYKGADSLKLLERVMEIISEDGYKISNIDATIIAQKPKLAPYIENMRENIARVVKMEKNRVNVKATTTEKLGFTGRGEGIASEAVCILTK
jgi:2-C-methyl-D-erythritol 2,4-cyclodiphosphate synthase